MKNVGKVGPFYLSKYILDLQIIPTATELRFYPDKNGKYSIPPEYKSDVIYGAVTKAITIDLYSEGVISNDMICEFINSISGNALSLSTGTTYHFCKDFSKICEDAVNQIKRAPQKFRSCLYRRNSRHHTWKAGTYKKPEHQG